MKLKHRTVPFSFKSIKDDGTFEGYASTFNNADQIRDVVMPGAFADTLVKWKEQDALPPVMWQHREPIGYTSEIAEDGKGLAVAGGLLIKDVQQAREAFALAKAKVVRGLSIGWDPVEEEYDGKTNTNKLIKIDLWEYSFVTFPMNTQATITAVKSILESGDKPTIRQFESFLRDEGGYSRKQAEDIALNGYATFLKQREAGQGESEIEIESILALFKEHPIQL